MEIIGTIPTVSSEFNQRNGNLLYQTNTSHLPGMIDKPSHENVYQKFNISYIQIRDALPRVISQKSHETHLYTPVFHLNSLSLLHLTWKWHIYFCTVAQIDSYLQNWKCVCIRRTHKQIAWKSETFAKL